MHAQNITSILVVHPNESVFQVQGQGGEEANPEGLGSEAEGHRRPGGLPAPLRPRQQHHEAAADRDQGGEGRQEGQLGQVRVYQT